MDELIDTDETLGGSLNDDFDLEGEMKKLKADGFHRWPNHVPGPMDGYDFAAIGPLLFSKPKCSFWHCTLFRLPYVAALRIHELLNPDQFAPRQ